ncbi:unnamed protein product [Rotaria sp. Silwood1]|nr:unnamed protein product [Rotaria sp. Silwood1]CAF3860567.1 unnamed protein product [Rotaria sp. Silwood1]CAF4738608.1 unnamed protein product [Rotaria sp. Silwood1]CAF4899370.1 unnamed protein product [Rotaria sp. Silwood1]
MIVDYDASSPFYHISIYFDIMQNHIELICQFLTDDTRHLLRFIILISIYFKTKSFLNLYQKHDLTISNKQINQLLLIPSYDFDCLYYLRKNKRKYILYIY